LGHLSLDDRAVGLTQPALFAALPAARARVAWMPVGRFPTRVERVDGLLPRGVELWVKREDESGELYGGNKVRKLEFLFGDARARGRARLVTFGGWGAHHVVATSLYGPRHGFRVEAAIVPQPLDDHVREQLLVDAVAGTRLIPVGTWLGVVPTWARARASRDAAWLAGGGSSPLGALGWVSGGYELRAQVQAGELPPFDALYAALGSGGTVAGLLWSLRAPVEVVAVRVVGALACGQRRVETLMRGIDQLLAGCDARIAERARLRLETRFAGRYGVATPASRDAVAAAARVGLTLDPIYTGKVMASLLDDARTGRLDGKRVLFLHSHNSVDLTPIARSAPYARSLIGM
jgi:1-aminocyclopropane-1-carboxylate deaminase/D-cysteine desulfhydrase-like pyridoxal-dependent ACC family enzyme